MGRFASASTGTPIAALTGAAANSATLAWLGGGSIAAGGGGMALGAWVLGGIALAPALLVGGFTLAHQGEKAMTQARAFEARVNRACADLKTLRGFLKQALRRVDELQAVLIELMARATHQMDSLSGRKLNLSRSVDRADLRRSGVLVRTIVDVLRTPIFDEDGDLSSRSATVLARSEELLAA